LTLDRTSSAPESTIRPKFGKDHLTLADWPIGVATFQQRRGENDDQRDFAEFVIQRQGGIRQMVTIESPSRIGLPTAGDHDTLVALLLLAKKQDFDSDIVRFMPWQLLRIMGWPLNQKSLCRLQMSLKRLKGVTATYENVWYSRRTKKVESCLITGILAEAKIVFRKGRRAAGALPESYVQWPQHMHKSLQEGSVLDLDLDLYFSCSRPGTKNLLRHLNKVWHAGKKPKPYARDLKELACGHLGLTDCKDLKRNFQELVAELESRGYLKQTDPTLRYQKIRPGIWRVNLELHPDQVRAKQQPTSTVRKKETATPPDGDAATLVCLYHRHRFGKTEYTPRRHEISRAKELLEKYDPATLSGLAASVATTVEGQYRGEDVYFGSAVPYFINAADRRQKKQRLSDRQETMDVDEVAADAAILEEKRQRQLRRQNQLAQWSRLPEDDRLKCISSAIAKARSDFDRKRLSRSKIDDDPPREVLDQMSVQSVRF
jgi:hypothetical protein